MPKSNLRIDDASRFLAGTLHEIRTPIQTIVSTIELIQDTRLDKEQMEYIRQIQFSAEVLLDLANNILDYTKIRSKEFKLETIPFDISNVTEQVVDLISIEAFNKGLEIVTDIHPSVPALVTGDPVRVQQIMLNLIKNAVKFTNEGYIHVVLAYSDDEGIYFKVTDSGIGITPEKQKRLFSEYYQADVSTYRKFGGTGLGLSISKNLVMAMNGHIGVRSNPFGGSIFWFKIPLKVAVEEKPVQVFPFRDVDQVRILIIDDNPLAIKSLKRKIEALGIYEIETAYCCDDAINQLEFAKKIHRPFTLAFVDMIMPNFDGWHVASEIKSHPEIKDDLRLCLLVPEGQMGSEAKMKMLNWYNGYLYKPIRRAKLREFLVEALASDAPLETLSVIREQEEIDLSKPSLEEKDTAQSSSATSPKVAEGLKILIAEDHPVNRKLLETFVRNFGADVYLAENGQLAVECIQQYPSINLIFMDIQMPVMSGVEATIKIREDGFKGIIVACTANNDSGDFEDYMKIGINDILVKPFKRATISNVIERWREVLKVTDFTTVNTIIPQTAQKEESPNGQVWDKNDFMDTIGNDIEFGKKLLADYMTQTSILLTQLPQTIETSDFAEIQKIGHTIKGSSASISASDLSALGKEMEDAAKNLDLGQIKTTREKLGENLKIFEDCIEAWKNGINLQKQEEKTNEN